MADDKKKREDFKKLLYGLAQQPVQQNDLHNYYERFEQLYGDTEHQQKFRHYYSDIFECLATIENSSQETEERKKTNMSMEVLAQNLYSLLDYANNQNNEKATTPDSLKKLYDHVNLEMARIQYYVTLIENSEKVGDIQHIASRLNELTESVKQATKNVENVVDLANNDVAQARQDIEQVKQDVDQAITQARQDVEQAKHNADKAKYNVEKASKKLKNVQKEYIAILSIFASVILAVSGGIKFSAEAISAISKTDVWNLLAVLGAIVWLFLNLLFLLMYYIGSLLDKDLDKKYYLTNINILMFAIVVTTMVIKWCQ